MKFNKNLIWALGIALGAFLIVLGWGSFSDKSKAYNIDDKGQYSMNLEAVNQINKQLDKMLSLCDSTVTAKDLNGLQKKYKGLVLQMPYNDKTEGASYEDIRLVGINTELLSEEERGSIEKSQLISLLQSQKNNLDQQVFNIKLEKDSLKNISIKKITLNVAQTTFETVNVDPKPLKVSFSSSPVYQEGTIYITYKNSIVPLFKKKHNTKINEDSCLYFVSKKDISHTDKVTKKKKHEANLAYLFFLKRQYNTATLLFENNNPKHNRKIDICWTSNDSVKIKFKNNINVTVYQPGEKKAVFTGSEDGTPCSISAEKAATLVVKMDDTDIREIKISPYNPYREYNAEMDYDIFTKQFVKAVGAADETATLDPVIGKYLEGEMVAYRNSKAPAYESMYIDAVVSNGYGEIVAAPYISNAGNNLRPSILESRKPECFKAYCVGSAFKIPVAAACIAAYPKLAKFKNQNEAKNQKLYYIDGNTIHFMEGELDLKNYWGNDKHWQNEGITMDSAIGSSDDVFFPAMMFAAINNGSTDLRKYNIFNVDKDNKKISLNNNDLTNLEDKPFFVNMRSLFKLKLNDAAYTDSTDAPWYYYYRALGKQRQCSFCHEDACLYLPQSYGRNIREMVTWGLGQGSCRLSTMKLCEIYTTCATKRLIRNSFFKLKEQPQAMNGVVNTKNFDSAYNGFLDDWRDAQGMTGDEYTLYPVHNIIVSINQDIKDKNDRLVLLAKTGTPATYYFPGANLYSKPETPWIDQGLYAMVIMTQKTYNQIQNNKKYDPNKVVTIVVRTTLQRKNNDSKNPVVGSGTAISFWTKDRLETVLKLRGII